MQSIKSRDSIVYFGDHTCYQQLNKYLENTPPSAIFILVDTNTHEHCLAYFLTNITTQIPIEVIEIEAGEIHKNIETCSGVWNSLSELEADRKALIINLGGGVVTDLGGFVACTFKRGVNYINVPTTLLSMVDASVGGKTGVDLGSLKNMVGVISESEMVLVMPSFLKTLPSNEIRSGFAEMLKHGLIQDQNYWERLVQTQNIHLEELDGLIHESVIIKNNIVTEDPFERSVRKYLNFGHTLGHAIESYFLTHPEKPSLLHGEAIAIGMITEAYLSMKLLNLPENNLKEISENFTKIYPAVPILEEDYQAIFDLLIFDKKNESGKILFVLLEQIGVPKYNCEVPVELLSESLNYYNRINS